MEINSIDFEQTGDGVCPAKVTVTMGIEEAIWIAKTAGKQRGSSPHSSIYDALVGDVFNRYWECGVDDACRARPVEIPPIVYPTEGERDE